MQCRISSLIIALLFFFLAVKAQIVPNDGGQFVSNDIDDDCPAAEPEPSVKPPYHPPRPPPPPPPPYPKPTPTPCAPCTSCTPSTETSTTTIYNTVTDTSTEITTTTEPPVTVTSTETETSITTDTSTETATITEAPLTVTSIVTTTTTATVTTSVPCAESYDLGSCSNAPKIWIDGAYRAYFGGVQYYAGILSTLLNLLCTRMQTTCGAPESSLQRCRAAEAVSNLYSGQEAVDQWNALMVPCGQ